MNNLPRPFNRRLDPEEQKPLEWVWRILITAEKLQRYTWDGEPHLHGLYSPYVDQAGYCLDRWSHTDFINRNR